ncbi:asparaginase [Telmatospirillum sp.]|uniref:asparaginase n=1 Tax=Telmatospirillum sp. TaxID=2079197 RepID=UPI002840C313|nr:asparaginase [Telmatospirillum sp.]MDR3438691.1 asparaginase [Telmatospirillum sp.]
MTKAPRPPVHHIDPVLVEVTRGTLVESVHRGAAVVCGADGVLLSAWGDIERAVFPRSAVKPLQALPLLETGAAEHFALSEAELALACASHSGQDVHVRGVRAWLDRLGLSEADLECGSHPPLSPEAARALTLSGRTPSPVHNNCSGKHCGMLTTARHMREPTRGYIAADHPVQQRIAQVLGEMTDCMPQHTPSATDGCGIPTFALPLSAVALAMARLAAPDGLGPVRGQAASKILAAMTVHPDLVAGDGRLTTLVMRAVPGLILKGGAEGVYAAVVPGKRLGIALKIDDGAGRAAEVAILALLRHLGVLSGAEEDSLAECSAPAVCNIAGQPVGVVRAAPEWLG